MLLRLVGLLNAWERSPYCGEMWTIIMVFLPKPDGGQRPIGLMPLLARVWSRIRQKVCAKWERSIDQSAFWGTSSARGCDKAAWLHNVLVAHAKDSFEVAGSFYVDLAKYYEHIGHEELRTAAQAWGFDLGLLKALCCTYLAPRRARIGSCLSQSVEANGTVVAGCSCATALAKLLLLSALRAAALAAPIARILNVVDDVSAHVVGSTTMVAQQLGAAYREFCAKVEEAHLQLSRHKTKALATSRALRDALLRQPGWDIGEDDFVDVHRDLGGDATSGSYRRVTTTVTRESQGMAQGRKLNRLFRPGLDRARIYRAGPSAKATWGSAIMGVPDGRLRTMRVGAVKAQGRLPRGAALGLASLAQTNGWKHGPLTIVTKTALTAYVEMIWASLLPEAVAQSCLKNGLALAQRLHPWRSVKEPSSALVLTLERVKWGFVQATHTGSTTPRADSTG